ncbi:uncharacterized protein LOC143914858 [Arctopsyche grandis]|uniref:uncharacterized protein LOC143914858 n=1 Tax=Arctopsyche grandis TaxID=121162 RepID=UPI00406D69C0
MRRISGMFDAIFHLIFADIGNIFILLTTCVNIFISIRSKYGYKSGRTCMKFLSYVILMVMAICRYYICELLAICRYYICESLAICRYYICDRRKAFCACA